MPQIKLENGIVSIEIGNRLFYFRRLTWLEEDNISNRPLNILSKALIRVDTLDIKEDSNKLEIIKALPNPIRERIYIIYKSMISEGRRSFTTSNIWVAPDIRTTIDKIKLEEDEQEEMIDNEVDMEIFQKSGLKGATRIG